MAGRFFPVQTIDLGPTGSFASFDEASLKFPGQLGAVIEDGSKTYRLIKFDNGAGNVASLKGGVAYWKDFDDNVVTTDASDSEALANGVAGGFLGVITDLNYGFIQCGGKQAVKVAASVVAGDKLMGHASTDNELTRSAAGVAPLDVVFAVALNTRGTNDGVTNSSFVHWLLGNLL
jgi:hypothetical protein